MDTLAAMDKQPFYDVVFQRYVFFQAIQGPPINSVTRFCNLTCMSELADWNTEIQFINKNSSNCLRRRFLQKPNLTLERITEKARTVELVEKQSIIMQPEEVQTGTARLIVTQDMYGFPSTKNCFYCGSSTHFANKYIVAKGKTCRKHGKEDILLLFAIESLRV